MIESNFFNWLVADMRESWIRIAVACFILGTVSKVQATDFSKDIKPLLSQHCIACHGGVKQASDLSFIYHDQALTVILPGKANESTLIERVTSEDDEERMPPPGHGPPLSSKEIELLRTWINDGAQWESHWSFVAPQSKPAPEVQQSNWVRESMDAFVLARLEGERLMPSPDAVPARWLRRVSLDLIGLPPTLEERDAFLSTVSTSGDAAFESEVQRLLDSPQFGERWASVWLDAVRYADSKGVGRDGRRSIWKYRDWVIDALNRGMPFDEFTVAQLAGDLVANPSLDDLVATACHRLTQTNEEGGTDDEQFRLEAVVDRVNTTWQVWQGMTFGCVQCHSHPYDPFRHTEYYQFLSFFNNTVDTDLSNDDPRVAIPLDHNDYDRAMELDKAIADLKQQDWQSGYLLLADESRWHTFSEMDSTTLADTTLAVETVDGVAHFHTVGAASNNTDIELEVTIPDGITRVTAIRFTGLPLDPEKALADSEWGFVLSHVEASAITSESDPQPLDIARVIGDDRDPFHDPQLSLNAKHPHGYGAYSRINHKRQAAFVLAEPWQVTKESRLRLKLSHRMVELGAFPLVTRRGSIAISDDESFTGWVRDEATLTARERLATLMRDRSEIESVETPVMRERCEAFSRSTYVFERGSFLDKGDRVSSMTPEVLPELASAETPTRLQLAHWIARPENPLTSRVVVNRFWAQMFGVGIVETQEDFGSSGTTPSHPDLLDDLAVRFATEMAWNIKSLLREIALSSTYRQSSKATAERLERDPDNRLLARGPRKRLNAEIVRDQALAISGLLSNKMYGPPVHPPLPADVWKPFHEADKWETPERGDPDRYRRSVYTYTKRSIPFPMFAAFDAPSREFCIARRLPSNTPLQALMTLNDQTFVEASHAFAERMLAAGETPHDQIAFGFQLATAREPLAVELRQLTQLFEKTQRSASDHSDSKKVAMNNVAIVLLNLDEVLCK
jgi:hypothetical protein